MAGSELECLCFYPTKEITDVEWLAIEYPLHHRFRTKYSRKDNGWELYGYTIN